MPTAMLGKRDAYEKLRGALDTEFATFFPLLKDVADFTCPRRPQFFVTDNNRGDRRSGKIIDGIAAKSADTFASGMMGGNTSPTSPWVRMTTSRPIAVEDYQGKEYLDGVTDTFLDVCAKSNIYDSFRSMYFDGAVFGTAVILIERDAEKVFHSTELPIGSYRLGLGKHDEVAVLFREFRMTVRSLVEEFGMDFGEEDIHWDRFSPQIKQHWDQNQLDIWIDVCHVICPNKDYDPDMMAAKYKKFSSCYYEKGRGSGMGSYEVGDLYLRESGYDRFPALVYHFDRSSGDAYGTNCPGFTSLGDNKALQNLHKKHAQAVDKMVHPPMGAPAGMENRRMSTLPNDITYWDPAMFGASGGKIEPLYQVQPNTGDLKEMIQDLRYQIKESYYVDVILSLINPAIDPKQMTAREVDERHDEKYMRFGSVLERVKPVLAGAVELILPWMYEDGLLEDPPESLQGEDIKLEFISVLAASQKLVRLGGIERFTQYTISLSQALAVPGARDVFAKVNVDNLLDSYAEGCSLPSKCMATDDQAMQTRKAAADLQAKQSMVQAAPQLAKAAKDASQANTSGDNALTRVAGALQGQGAAQ